MSPSFAQVAVKVAKEDWKLFTCARITWKGETAILPRDLHIASVSEPELLPALGISSSRLNPA